jgi:hypothetical protein
VNTNGSLPEQPPDSWQPVNLNTLPDQPPIRPTLAGVGIVYPGKRHVFSGLPESAKTIAAYIILIAAARQHTTSILIDFEMGGYDARQRLRELGATPDDIDRIHYIEPDQPATPDRIQALVGLQPCLTVIDAGAGAYNLESLDDNKRQDVERFAALYVRAFWRAGVATIIVDHVVKNSETRGRFAIGSERKLGGADVHLGFDTIQPISRGSSGRYKITTHKDRGGYLKRGHLADLHLESDPASHQIGWQLLTPPDTSTGYFRPTHQMEKVSIDLEHRTEPVSRNTCADAVGGNKAYLLKAIDALAREGFVAETDGPRRSKQVASVRPYRENDPTCNPETDTTGSLVLSSSDWFPEPQSVTGSTGSPPYGGNTRNQNHTDDPEQLGWFQPSGTLQEAPFDPDYLDTINTDDIF